VGAALIISYLFYIGLYIWYLIKYLKSRDAQFTSELTIKAEIDNVNKDENINDIEEAKHQRILLYLFIAGFFIHIPWFIGSVIYSKDKIKVYQWCNRIAAIVALITEFIFIAAYFGYANLIWKLHTSGCCGGS